MPVFLVCLTVISLACLAGSALVTTFALKLSRQVYESSCLVARTQQESGVKYASALAQVAAIIQKQVDENVRGRVKQINAIIRPSVGSDPPPIEEPPPSPDVFQSSVIDDEHEILREFQRYRSDPSEGKPFDFPIRDHGIGSVEEV